jgi:putative transposase
MARRPRFHLPGYPQHVVQRGNNRQPCFFVNEDYQFYLGCLEKACQRHGCAVHAYVLMTNHVHLLVTPTEEFALSWVMQDIGRRYVYRINRRHHRSGTLWEGRYKACLVDTEHYLLACYRYLELNPVRAKIVEHPEHYRWSSCVVNAHGNTDPIVQQHPLYVALGRTAVERQRAYRELLRDQLDKQELTTIREALNRQLILGDDGFIDKIQSMTRHRLRPGKPGRPRSILKSSVLADNGT